MATVVAGDWSIAANGDIRYTGTGTNNTVIELHRYLGDLMDQAEASGDDILDITDSTASERSTDNIINLKYPYNIDDIAAQHLYDGSVTQSRTSANLGEDVWDGILVFATAGTYLYIMQNGLPASPNFWTTGINADATSGISHRFMLKVKDNNVEIDGQRLVGMTKEYGYTYSEFKINRTSRGNNVMALTYAVDLNNNVYPLSAAKSWTTITNIEGYQSLVVGTAGNYYSQWDKAAYTINQFYERIKYLTRRSTIEDSGTDGCSGTSYTIGNATLVGQAQIFSNGNNNQYLTRCHFRLKKTGTPTGSMYAKLYTISGAKGTTGIPTGTAMVSSAAFDVSKLTTSYLEKELYFTTQVLMTSATDYAITLEYSGGDVSNYVQVEGAATGTHTGNAASKTGTTWTPAATADLWFHVYASSPLYGVAGERVRGITHEVSLTTPRSGSFLASDLVSWGSGATAGTGIMFAIDSAGTGTKMWIQLLSGVIPSASVTITGSNAATATNTGTPVDRVSELKFPLCGASTGSAIIGSYGFGLKPSTLTSSDMLFDLSNTQKIPPNNVTFTVSGLLEAHDYVLVGPADGTSLDENQFTIDATYSGAAVESIAVSPAIPTDTPAAGTIRVKCNSGIFKRIEYSSYTGDTFTVTSTDFSTDNATSGNDCFISYIDKLADASPESGKATFTSVYLASRPLFVRVRDGGASPIKTFETTGTLGSAGGGATVNRIADT